MTSQNAKRLILVILLGVLAVTAVQTYRVNRPQAAPAVDNIQTSSVPDRTQQGDGRIRLDLIGTDTKVGDVGRNNLFQYRTAAVPAVQAGPTSPIPPVPTPVDQRPIITVPPTPPPPPPIPLKYQGFAVMDQSQGVLTAFLSDDAQHFNVTQGEVLMGRFRIERITTTAVDVQDLEFNRRQTLPLQK
jgi:hypothetical protein